ncbi:hypothetical protein EV401DRAFT_1955287 [Pisolithus croceorrhizus]|nr:hypothetical protein EV401DRAFT_1955287 [Pisolithus croceorrhizus]
MRTTTILVEVVLLDLSAYLPPSFPSLVLAWFFVPSGHLLTAALPQARSVHLSPHALFRAVPSFTIRYMSQGPAVVHVPLRNAIREYPLTVEYLSTTTFPRRFGIKSLW